MWNLPATGPGDVWSYDFMGARLRSGGNLRILNVVDQFTRVALGCRVDASIGARDVVAELAELFRIHGRPRVLRSDNGREFIAETVVAFLREEGVRPAFIEKGSPQQNPFVERFNGTMRDEKLNGEEFHSVLEARVVLGEWIREYNQLRPHRGLGMKTPLQSPRSGRERPSERDLRRWRWTTKLRGPHRGVTTPGWGAAVTFSDSYLSCDATSVQGFAPSGVGGSIGIGNSPSGRTEWFVEHGAGVPGLAAQRVWLVGCQNRWRSN